MHVDYAAEKIRPIIHAYFYIAFLLLGLIGQACCELTNKAALRRGQKLPLHRMAGWFTGFTFLTSTFKLRNFPGGPFLGLVMLLVTVLTPVNTILVAAFVVNVQVSSRCGFGQGMVSNLTGPYIFSGPPYNGQPKRVASVAQLYSVSNGGQQGVYQKVNTASTFQAQAQDVIANWVCTAINDDQTYSPGTTPASIEADLRSQGYLYDQVSKISQGPSQGYEHLVAWSASTAFAPWDVKAAIDLSALPTDATVMRSFHCTLDSPTTPGAADAILSAMDTTWTLSDWLQEFQGGCYDGSYTPARSDDDVVLAQLLNSMLMVQAGNNNLLQHSAAGGGGGGDATQGCLVPRANIPVVIFVLLAIPALLVGGGVLALLGLLAAQAIWRFGRAGDGGSEWREPEGWGSVPADLPSWLLQAARESAMRTGGEVPAETAELAGWGFGVVAGGDDGRGVARLVRGGRASAAGDEEEMRLRSSPGSQT